MGNAGHRENNRLLGPLRTDRIRGADIDLCPRRVNKAL
jgi:hypothetical protein